MGQKAASNIQYRKVSVLQQVHKRTVKRALPTALHIGCTSTFAILVFAIINVSVTYALGPKNAWSKLVQSGTMMAMITVTILAMPCLGKSVSKGVQRIAGVMAGGWIFYALYASCQLWWFLAVCLTVWAFLLVAASFFLTGKQFLFPVALVTAFIVATNFNSVQQAMTMTAVKTVAISGAIVVYTLVSMLLFPLTATQQVVGALSDAFVALHQLAEVLLVKGQASCTETEESAAATATKDIQEVAKMASPTPPTVDSKAVKGSKSKAAGFDGHAGLLAAQAAHNLQLVQQLLPATAKERYMGSIGSCKCFLPSVRRSGLDDSKVMAVVFNASQVLRSLMIMMSELGTVPVAKRTPPAQFADSDAKQLVEPMAESAVEALKDLAEALPPSGPIYSSVRATNLAAFGATLQQLVAETLDSLGDQDLGVSSAAHSGAIDSHTAAAPGLAAAAGDAGSTAGTAAKWQRAAAAAAGLSGSRQGRDAQQVAAAFGKVLSDAVLSEESQVSRWCMMLVVVRQLGKAMAALTASTNHVLPMLPGAPAANMDDASADVDDV